MKWYHWPVLISVAFVLFAVEQRLMQGSAGVLLMLASIPGLIWLSSKSLELLVGNRL